MRNANECIVSMQKGKSTLYVVCVCCVYSVCVYVCVRPCKSVRPNILQPCRYTHVKALRWKASELLCHPAQRLQARGALASERLGPQVPCSARPHRKAPGCSQTWRPVLFQSFHLRSAVDDVPWAILTRSTELHSDAKSTLHNGEDSKK